MSPHLHISGLHVSIDDTEIIRGLDLQINEGEVHAIMGPNGSGKSTLVNALMGHPAYTVTAGSVEFNGVDLLAMDAHERSLAGLFLAFQYPKEIAGVTLRNFLFAAYSAHCEKRSEKRPSPLEFHKQLEATMESLHIDPTFAERSVNTGFSGGEKKKAEVLQMHTLKPSCALLDETDSGLDVDALKIVGEGVQSLRDGTFSAVVVTHYARILEYLEPDHVHVMVRGQIVESVTKDLSEKLEK